MGGEDINIPPKQKKKNSSVRISQYDTSFAKLFIVFNSFPSWHGFIYFFILSNQSRQN